MAEDGDTAWACAMLTYWYGQSCGRQILCDRCYLKVRPLAQGVESDM